jgi:positive regulator of sigma E activity
MVIPSLAPHRPASHHWQGACGVFDGGRFALIVRCRASRGTCGTCQAKEYPENMMVNKLPSKTKEKLCYY